MGKVVSFPKAPKQDFYAVCFMVCVVEHGTKVQAVKKAEMKLDEHLRNAEATNVSFVGVEKLPSEKA